jgi:hypothetical protein
MRPHIGSHHSVRDDAHLWHFVRTSPRGAPPFREQQRSRGDIAVLVFCIGVVLGIVTALIWQAFK